MRIYTGLKTLIYYAVVIFAALVAYHIFPAWQINDKQSIRFSPVRAAKDINIISKKPHSIEHPKERKVVGDYLFYRLQQMGGSAQIFEYDSIKCKFGGYFDIANIYAEFAPDQVSDTTQYMLLIAHYDSRYKTKVLEDTVYSYGAADDGYGLGVILESISLALKYKEYWRQGIKVLFTDSEEHGLDGMKNAFEHNKEIFSNVNIAINVDARGVKGPALLFETSPGNSKLIELYKEAEKPYTYSLTSLVYRFLPNDSDLSVIIDTIPGMNFSVIDNLKYYHTDLDNYSNISLKSIQHYGCQLEPMIYKYLISSDYSNPDSFKSSDNAIFFTIPFIGLVTFSKLGYIILNVVAYIIFILTVAYLFTFKKINFSEIVKSLKYAAIIFVGALVVGELMAWLVASINGEEFSLTSVKYVKYDYIIMITSLFILFLWTLITYRIKVNRSLQASYNSLVGAQIFLMILSLLLCAFVVENFFVFVPFAVSVLAFVLSMILRNKFVYLISAFVISLLGFSFIYVLITALSFGAFGILLALSYLYINILITQYYCYKRNNFII